MPRLCILALLAVLGGCAGASDDQLSRAFVTGGKYDLYTCKEIAAQLSALRDREQELKDLSARAEQGPAGGLISTLAYRSDQLQTRGQMQVLAETASRKHCATQSGWASERSQY